MPMKSPLENDAAELIARRFQALSDSTRLRILDLLRVREEASVGELTETLGTSQQNVSKHLAALHAEGFVSRRKRGTRTLYRISDPGVLELCDRVCAGIESQLAELEAMISAQPAGAAVPPAARG
jgi:DNA-binding transcriptional ArsR family regulator